MKKSSTHKPEELFSQALEIDEDELLKTSKERGKVLDISDQIRLLAKQNHLSLFKNRAERIVAPDGGWQTETELQLQSLAHPDCRFVDVTLAISFELTPGAKVLSVQPERAMVHKKKVSESVKPLLELGIPGIGLRFSLGGEKTIEQDFNESVLTSYNGETFATWCFRSPTKDYELDLNIPLKLSVHYPAHIDALRASIEVSAKVMTRGWREDIPLKKNKMILGQAVEYLDRE